MEGVQGHLCCGLADALCGDNSHHLTRGNDRALILKDDFLNENFDGIAIKAFYHKQILRRQVIIIHNLE